MPSARRAPWSLLGSTLWLRRAGRGDRARLDAFRARGDLVRSAGPDEGLVLVATDVVGAPACLLVLSADAAAEEGSLGFVAPRHETAVLEEALRLAADLARSRTRWERIAVRIPPTGTEPGRLLAGWGWTEGTPGRWILALHPPQDAPSAAPDPPGPRTGPGTAAPRGMPEAAEPSSTDPPEERHHAR